MSQHNAPPENREPSGKDLIGNRDLEDCPKDDLTDNFQIAEEAEACAMHEQENRDIEKRLSVLALLLAESGSTDRGTLDAMVDSPAAASDLQDAC